MGRLRFIELDGKLFQWRDVVAAYREQAAKLAKPEQAALFELREDHRPAGERSAADRYLEPNLFADYKL